MSTGRPSYTRGRSRVISGKLGRSRARTRRPGTSTSSWPGMQTIGCSCCTSATTADEEQALVWSGSKGKRSDRLIGEVDVHGSGNITAVLLDGPDGHV